MDTKEKVLNAALEIFVERGFHATPTSAISKRAGVSSGILFHYYKTKDEMITSLFLDIKLQFLEQTSVVLLKAKEHPTIEALRECWDSSLAWSLEYPLKFGFMEQYHHTPYMQQVCEDEKIRYWMEIRDTFFETAQKNGILRPQNMDFLNLMSMKYLAGVVEFIMMHPEFKKDTDFLNRSWESLLTFLGS